MSFSSLGHGKAHNIDSELPEKNHEDLYERENINVTAQINKYQSPSVTSVISELDKVMDSILENE